MKHIVASITLAAAASAIAQTPATPPAPPPPPARGPSLELALEAARTALEDCRGRQQSASVSVVDSAGVLKVLLASDGGHARGVNSSTNKAVTAVTYKSNTTLLGEQAKTDAVLAAKLAANPNSAARGGGVPLLVGDTVIGAIGVGGARGGHIDEACALAGIAKVQSRLQ